MYYNYQYEKLFDFCMAVFLKIGYSEKDAHFITDTLLTADLYGIESHGMNRMVRYHKLIENGGIRVDAQPIIEFETPVSAVVNGNKAMGQLVSRFCTELAIEKAKKVGMAAITVHTSNHFGIAGYYAKMGSDQGLLGVAMTNSEAILVPTNGTKAMLGSNPIAFAYPAKPYPFLFDASTSVVTRGKLEVYKKNNMKIEEGWGVDEFGKPCYDAGRVIENIVYKRGGGILPTGGASEITGGHKGYGFGMICEMFCSIFSGGETSNHKGKKGETCHSFFVLDPHIFGDADAIENRLSFLMEEIRNSPKAEGQTRIYTHGEKEMLAEEEHKKNGIDVNINTIGELKDLCDYLKMDFVKYFGDIDTSDTIKSSYI